FAGVAPAPADEIGDDDILFEAVDDDDIQEVDADLVEPSPEEKADELFGDLNLRTSGEHKALEISPQPLMAPLKASVDPFAKARPSTPPTSFPTGDVETTDNIIVKDEV